MPYFSIIIPTRNRAALVVDAALSVLEQDYTDFELIISDNSDPEQADQTFTNLHTILKDNRARYIRPPGILPMTAHWNWALDQSRGLFTGFLTDRSVYRLYTLETVRTHCGNQQVVSFLSDAIIGESSPFRIKLRLPELGSQVLQSDQLLLDFSKSKFSKRAPRMLNSFCRTDLLRQIAEKYGSTFTGISPDFSFCFRILDHVTSILSLDARLLLVGGVSESNGAAFQRNKLNAASKDFSTQLQFQSEWLKYSPIPSVLNSIPNVILGEYEIARTYQRSGRFRPIDKNAFYKEAVAELEDLIAQGSDLNEALAAVKNFGQKQNLRASSGRNILWRRFKLRLRTWRNYIKELFFSIAGSIAAILRRPKPNQPILKIRRSCTFSSVMAALRYDAEFHRRHTNRSSVA
jgi:hypothetical protein